METLGGWHPRALEALTRLGRQLARHTGGEDSEVLNHLMQRLGILLMKGNSSLLLSRAPDFCDPEIDGVVDS